MKLFNLSIFTVLSLTSSTAHADCFTTGYVGVPSLAYNQIEKICGEDLAGNLAINLSKGKCLPLQSFHYDFTIYNLKKGQNSLSVGDCVAYMKKQIACSRGGDTSYSNIGWRFVADPNAGDCLH
ncbi:hypothetical protein DSL72_003070 [Monilinia vaccinii-corymbosi]|uniref:Glycan binding protein Y3-like domain-containing protein n=1 Tax=Monilinia vaccinii-corymbosi TaxID=61207 RepID=A0A8A3NVZ0_9HELO|nr:hypothetical protein DSL72_003070 [Monilinia vaccinii-corymbosi]